MNNKEQLRKTKKKIVRSQLKCRPNDVRKIMKEFSCERIEDAVRYGYRPTQASSIERYIQATANIDGVER